VCVWRSEGSRRQCVASGIKASVTASITARATAISKHHRQSHSSHSHSHSRRVAGSIQSLPAIYLEETGSESDHSICLLETDGRPAICLEETDAVI
jgi:hypothetical protein